jgi:tetratricopeptide (TPR) repeat protein
MSPRPRRRSLGTPASLRPGLQAAAFALLAALCVATWAPQAHAADDRPTARTGRDEGVSDAELERLLGPLVSPDAAARKEAATSVTALGPSAVPAFARKLAELRKSTAPSVGAAIKVARDFAGKKTDVSLADALVAMGEPEATRGDIGYRTAVTTAVLLEALAKAGTTPAVKQLVKVAVDHGGALRSEVARHVQALGDRAVATLIETRKEPSSELRRWAASQLEGMGKRVPGDAVQTKDNQVLADVLRAFANVHDMDALPVLLSFVNSDRIQVRSAAREAVLQFAEDAIWKLREAYSNVTGKPAPEEWRAPELAKELFAAYDRLRLQEVYGLLDEGLAKQKEGKLEEAVAEFDKVLARQPTIERRGEMLPAYVGLADSLEETDPPRALALYRKALRIWPETARAGQIEAQIAYLEGKELLARGIADAEPFKRALALDPAHDKARAELNRLETHVEERHERLRALAAAAAVVIVAFVGIVLFGGRARRAARA